MEMIIGGSFQGKLQYAKEQHRDITEWTDGSTCTKEELMQARGVYDFQEYIRRNTGKISNADLTAPAEELIRENPDVVLVSTEVGYGIVPMDARERAFREAVGRVCTQLASHSTKVTRVVCGIGTVIKDA